MERFSKKKSYWTWNVYINRCGYLVNRCGYLVNRCGYLVNRYGYLVNRYGYLVNRCGYLVNRYGYLVNRYGYLVNNTTNFLWCLFEDDIKYTFRPNPAIIRFSSERVLVLYRIYAVMSRWWDLIIRGIYIIIIIIITYLLTYSMVQSPSWEANWIAASQEIPRISWNPKVHYYSLLLLLLLLFQNYKMCVSSFSTFVWFISHAKKHWVRCDQKYVSVFTKLPFIFFRF